MSESRKELGLRKLQSDRPEDRLRVQFFFWRCGSPGGTTSMLEFIDPSSWNFFFFALLKGSRSKMKQDFHLWSLTLYLKNQDLLLIFFEERGGGGG